jgi:hypothetical protein
VVLDAAILSGLNRIELVLPTTTMRSDGGFDDTPLAGNS